MFRLVGNDARPFERIAAEIAGYYLLAFEATNKDRDGTVHRVDVSLTRDRGVLRARSAFRMAPVAPSARTREQELVDVLRNARAATELPVRAATYTYAEPGSTRLRVVVSTEADAADGPASQVLLGYVLTNTAGVIASSGAHLAVGGRHTFSAVVDPGIYRLRVAGIDPLGRRGLVERGFADAVEARRGLRLSDLILAPVPATTDAILQPLVDRIAESRITANVELYESDATSVGGAHVLFEITPQGDNVSLVSVPADLLRRETLTVARAVLSLAALRPGRYTAHARVMINGEEVERVYGLQ